MPNVIYVIIEKLYKQIHEIYFHLLPYDTGNFSINIVFYSKNQSNLK